MHNSQHLWALEGCKRDYDSLKRLGALESVFSKKHIELHAFSIVHWLGMGFGWCPWDLQKFGANSGGPFHSCSVLWLGLSFGWCPWDLQEAARGHSGGPYLSQSALWLGMGCWLRRALGLPGLPSVLGHPHSSIPPWLHTGTPPRRRGPWYNSSLTLGGVPDRLGCTLAGLKNPGGPLPGWHEPWQGLSVG